MNKFKYPLITLITIFVSATSLFAQSPKLENKSGFCYKQGTFFLNEIHDQIGDKYFIISAADDVYYNEELVYTSHSEDSTSLLIVKTNIENELLWTKSLPTWYKNQFAEMTLTNDGIILLTSTTYKGDYNVEELPKISNNDKLMYYAISIDSTGNTVNLFPLVTNLEGLPIPFGPYGTNIRNYGDTLIVTGSISASARFGKNDVLVSHPNFRTSLYIARFSLGGEFIDIDFLYHSGNISQNRNGLSIIGNKAYCYFNFNDTLRSEKDESIISLPILSPGFGATKDVGLFCYDLMKNEVSWLKTIINGGDMSPFEMQEWGDNMFITLRPYATQVMIDDTTFNTQVFSDLLYSFNKNTGEISNSFSMNSEDLGVNFTLSVENSSSILISCTGAQGYIRINNSDKLIQNTNNSYFFRVDDNLNVEYIGETDMYARLYTNKNDSLILEAISSNYDVHFIFGTELETGPCTDSDQYSKTFVDLSYLEGEKMGVKGLNSSSSLISIYPNPASNKINIEIQSSNKPYSIIDVQGRTLQKGILENTKTELDLSKFSNGIYFIRIENDVRKIIIN